MEQNNTENPNTLDTYIKGVKNQEIKGILLKLKNEIRRTEVDSGTVESILNSLREKEPSVAKDIEEFIQS